MAQTVRPTAPIGPDTASRGKSGTDWTVQATDTIDSVVSTIRDKSVVPLTTAARGIVYGLVAAVLGFMALVLVAIAMMRALRVYLPFYVGTSHARAVWISDAIVGGIFSLAGLFLLRKAKGNKR